MGRWAASLTRNAHDAVRRVGLGGERVEELVDDARDDTTLLQVACGSVAGVAAAHGVRLAAAGLAIGEDGRVVAIHAAGDERRACVLKDLLLCPAVRNERARKDR